MGEKERGTGPKKQLEITSQKRERDQKETPKMSSYTSVCVQQHDSY